MMRFDVTTNDWVIFAPNRARRPQEFRRAPTVRVETPTGPCPFCPGNEALTPPEIVAVRDNGGAANSPGWRIRVMPNKYPAMLIEESPNRQSLGKLFRQMGNCGAHEVIVDSPDHTRPLALQPVEQITLLLQTLQQRYIDLMRDVRFQSIVIFKNHGERAGTSLCHPHCQLIATAVVPNMLRQKVAVAAQHFDQQGTCLYCDMLAEELADQHRILLVNDHYVALLPYASKVPFETWIIPLHRQSSFRWVDPYELKHLADVLKQVLGKLHFGLGDPDFNLTIDTAPRGDEDAEYFLWHIRILPRLTTPAGFELGSGMSINTVLPEEATAFLADVKVSE
jgi:UDPglucose--hexose-1-phosphate uridylyltransferase